ncbi:MAG TPA: hypothetical protein VD997_07030 [Phycisphaerales bacterium]|nr:hypothetical protein [Phycisphaerales bacterium]
MPTPGPTPDPTLKPFVYSWGLRSRAPISHYRRALVFAPLAAAALTYAAVRATNDPNRWIYAAIAAVVWVLAITLFVHPIIARRTPASRNIKVHEFRRVIEFHNAPITTGLFRTRTLPHYECPIADVRSVRLRRGATGPHLFIETPEGRVHITTRHDTIRVEELYLILRDLTNAPRPR